MLVYDAVNALRKRLKVGEIGRGPLARKSSLWPGSPASGPEVAGRASAADAKLDAKGKLARLDVDNQDLLVRNLWTWSGVIIPGCSGCRRRYFTATQSPQCLPLWTFQEAID